MDERRTKARQLAAEALEDLGSPDMPIEIPLRKAIRVATLMGHAYWRAWFTLQTRDIGTDSNPADVKDRLASMIGDEQAAKEALEKVALDYMRSRSLRSHPDKIYGPSVADLEAFVQRNSMLMNLSPPTDVRAIMDELRNMLSGIRSRLHDYLLDGESTG